MRIKISEYDVIISRKVNTIKDAIGNLIKISELCDNTNEGVEGYEWYLENMVLPMLMLDLNETLEFFATITKDEFWHITGYASDIVMHFHNLDLAKLIKKRYFELFNETERKSNQVDTTEIENLEGYV